MNRGVYYAYTYRSYSTYMYVQARYENRISGRSRGHCISLEWVSFHELTLQELQSRFGNKPLKFQVFFPQLFPKRDCGSKRRCCGSLSTTTRHVRYIPGILLYLYSRAVRIRLSRPCMQVDRGRACKLTPSLLFLRFFLSLLFLPLVL